MSDKRVVYLPRGLAFHDINEEMEPGWYWYNTIDKDGVEVRISYPQGPFESEDKAYWHSVGDKYSPAVEDMENALGIIGTEWSCVSSIFKRYQSMKNMTELLQILDKIEEHVQKARSHALDVVKHSGWVGSEYMVENETWKENK